MMGQNTRIKLMTAAVVILAVAVVILGIMVFSSNMASKPSPQSKNSDQIEHNQMIEEQINHPQVFVGTVKEINSSHVLLNPASAQPIVNGKVVFNKIDAVINSSTAFVSRKVSQPLNPSKPYIETSIAKDSITVGTKIELDGTWSGETFTATSVIIASQ